MTIEEGARILDLRNDEDYRAWNASGLPNFLGSPDFDRRARQSGIDGVYDRSVGGLAIYNVASISAPMLSREFEAMPRMPSPSGGPKP